MVQVEPHHIEAKAQLARAKEKFSADHPDVVRLQRTVDGLEKAVAAAGSSGKPPEATTHSDNPVYIQVKGQLDALAVQRISAAKRLDDLQAKFADYERR